MVVSIGSDLSKDFAVACRKGGSYFGKRSRGMLQPDRPYMLAVEDPKDPSNDLAKGSYNIQKVRQIPLQSPHRCT